MTPGLEPYFERELAFLADFREAFQKRYPAEAGRLMPDRTRVPDPHLERFIEGFAALSARVHHKLDSELPELTESIAQVMYPHLLRPIPSMAIAQFECDPVEPPGFDGLVLPKETHIRSPRFGNPLVPCRFRTGYPVHLWPVELMDAQMVRGPFPGAPPRTQAVIRIQFAGLKGAKFADLNLSRLRLFLNGEKQLNAMLYEVLLQNCVKVVFRSLDEKRPPLELTPAECLFPVGFNLDEGLLPFPRESFLGYRLLMELLAFPAKFHFIDLGGWDLVRQAGFGNRVEAIFYLTRTQENLEQGIQERTFLLGCTPIINLFEQSAEPIAVTQTKTEYRVVPSRINKDSVEVFSVDDVMGVEEGRSPFQLQPYYHFHLGQSRENHRALWHASRRASLDEGDRGTEIYLFVMDGDWHPKLPANMMLDVQTTCTNRDFPARYMRGGDVLRLEGAEPGPMGPITCLQAPTPTLRPPLRRAAHWKILSQLGLNHKTLTDPIDGVNVLREILRLCDFSDSEYETLLAAVNRQVIEGVLGLQARRVLGRASSGGTLGLCRGVELTMELDEKNYVGMGVFFFSCVIERFLALYTAVNSFSQLIVKTVQGDIVKKWPPRAAERQLP